MNILVVDDHVLFRDGVVSMLKDQPDMKVVAEAGSVSGAVKAAFKYRPDLILLDLGLPDGTGFDVMQAVLARLPNTIIVILTIHEDDTNLLAAVHRGAAGYLLKNLSGIKFIESLRGVGRGEVALSRKMMARVMKEVFRMGVFIGTPQSIKNLTPRELEIAKLIGNGASNHVIAERLSIAETTVKIHVHNLLKKLDMHNRGEIASFTHRQEINT